MRKKLETISDSIKDEIIALSDSIYNKPELGNCEFESSKLHAELLKKHGFTVTMPYLGLKTAFRAEYSSPKKGPTICYMAEYDALPEVGHGCGHNMLGATSSAAGIMLSEIINEAGGKVVVLGCPAEETNGAKVHFVERGVFKEMDVAIIDHPSGGYHSESGHSLAMQALQFEYFGKAAHAAASPEAGVNALDAVITLFTNINALRQQTRSDARIHGIISEGGVAPNIIPDHCVAKFYVRAATKAYLEFLAEKVKNCGKAAAMATGCKLSISEFELAYDDLVTNKTMSSAFTECLKYMGVDKVLPTPDSGSLDTGNVSHACPTIHPYFPITPGISLPQHTKEFAAATQTKYARTSMMTTARAMALLGYRIITEPALLSAIKTEFKNAVK